MMSTTLTFPQDVHLFSRALTALSPRHLPHKVPTFRWVVHTWELLSGEHNAYTCIAT